MKSIVVTFIAVFCAVVLFSGGVALAQTTNWMDELSSSVNFYKNRYPTTDNVEAGVATQKKERGNVIACIHV